ncbi:phenylalanine--tRNA ligase subunit alpha [Niabella soli]|uniref:Phenylalanine--tRNA ligase alpha subunit n=1 Tax=Niabella soli DSM 19437 TaxID=929713 RepID=W0F083_9BACT|nr:phenylalanine--tRNA ligase subunit alpha [Niabella soli]AHF16422.1 phenylalanyl-tRNA synthetase subunit alpha [Niabella soli DSM 19437]
MQDLVQKLQIYKSEIGEYTATDEPSVEAFRIKWLGSKGLVKTVMGAMKDVPVEQKKEAGQLLNDFKLFVEAKFSDLKEAATASSGGAEKARPDLSLPGDTIALGSRHPITLMRNKIISIFQRLGFAVAEGPEIEDDWHNFTALNMPAHHPARDMQDTFYVDAGSNSAVDWLLRTHTSNTQIRVMEKGVLPIRVICPGRVYRNETISARSHCFFHQVEGLYIDENVSFADLKQTLYFFVKEMYGGDVRVRFRPSYFPFTEPSAEMDVSCFICGGKGCNICKKTGWVEILGCGMIHPNVLQNCGIDPEKYTGFAFGMGVERPAMLKYGINDIRLFSENDVRFLRQFTSAT